MLLLWYIICVPEWEGEWKLVTALCAFELVTDSCCPQVRHLIPFFWTFQWEGDRSLEEGERVVGGAFEVALTLGSGVLALWGDGLTYPGQSTWLVPGPALRGVRASHFGEGGVSGYHWPEREHPVGSFLLLPRRGHIYIYIYFFSFSLFLFLSFLSFYFYSFSFFSFFWPLNMKKIRVVLIKESFLKLYFIF